MRGYRQPLPSWRARELRQQQDAREAAYQENVAGPVMGLDSELPDDVAPAPIAQGELHHVGRQFILAGNAVFTVAGREHRYTFRVSQPKDDESTAGQANRPKPYFVSVMTAGGDRKWLYAGVLDIRTGQVRSTKGSKIALNTPSMKALLWTLARVWADKPLPAPAAIYHEGRCGRCGRPLTVPESILTGFGPDCAAILGIDIKAMAARVAALPKPAAPAVLESEL